MVLVEKVGPASKMKNNATEQIQPQAPLSRGILLQAHLNGVQDMYLQKDGGPRPVRQNMFRTAVS